MRTGSYAAVIGAGLLLLLVLASSPAAYCQSDKAVTVTRVSTNPLTVSAETRWLDWGSYSGTTRRPPSVSYRRIEPGPEWTRLPDCTLADYPSPTMRLASWERRIPLLGTGTPSVAIQLKGLSGTGSIVPAASGSYQPELRLLFTSCEEIFPRLLSFR